MAQPTDREQISRMLTGYWVSQALYVAAKLRIADSLAVGPKSADELAKASGTQGRSLYRLLRALASLGIFAEEGDRRFALTPLGECLRSDLPGSQWAMAIMVGEEHYQAWGDLLGSVRTGEIAFDKIYGKPVFDYLAERPEQARIFDDAMTGVHGHETSAVLESYDFSAIGVLADIGGGNGTTLCGILKRFPKMTGILFDLDNVVERAKAEVEAAGLSQRCRLVGGNFFESVPGGVDAYLLRHIIHDWDDVKATAILKNIHEKMEGDAKLLVVETVIPPGNEPSFAKLLDLAMLVIPGGLERTEEEYRQLYDNAGFRLSGVVPTRAEVSVIEGKKK